MAAKALLLVLLLGRAAAEPSCSPGQACLGDDEAEDGSLLQKRTTGAKLGAGCVQPTGESVSQEGPGGLEPVTKIVASGHVAVKFKTGSAASYTMTTFESVEPHVSVAVDGGILTIKLDAEVCETSAGHHHPEVNVTSPEFLTDIEFSDGADFYFVGDSAIASELSVEASGVSWIVLEGENVVEVDKCRLHAHGSAEIKEAHCDTLNVAATDEAKIEVHLHGTATGTVGGKAELEVVGGGDTTGVTVSGEGEIEHKHHGDE